MATEITEFFAPQMRFGHMLPVYPLPHRAHTALAVGGILQVASDTQILLVQPAEDVRYRTTTDGQDPAAPDANSPILKAGQRYDFEVRPGYKFRTIAA